MRHQQIKTKPKKKQNKKRIKIILIIILIIIILLSFVKLTGFAIRSTGTLINTCTDSDGGKEYWIKGSVRGDYTFFATKDFQNQDECKDETNLIEYYCIEDKTKNRFSESIKFKCPEGCENGKCKGEPIEIPDKTSIIKIIKRFFRI